MSNVTKCKLNGLARAYARYWAKHGNGQMYIVSPELFMTQFFSTAHLDAGNHYGVLCNVLF